MPGELNLLTVGFERMAGTRRRHLVQMAVDLLDRSPLAHQLSGTLLADARTARNVIRGVSHQGEHIDNPSWGHTEEFFCRSLVQEPFVARVPYLDPWIPD